MTRSKKIRRVNKIRDTLEHANEMQRMAFDLAENLDKNLNSSIVSRRLLTDKTWDEQMIEDSQDRDSTFRIGDRVAVKYKGGPDWFECTVIGINTNGSYDVRYPDGEEESRVRWIRSLPTPKKKKKRKKSRRMRMDRLMIVVFAALFSLYLVLRLFFSILSIFVGDDVRCVVPTISSFEGVHRWEASCVPGNTIEVGTACAVEPLKGFECVGMCKAECLENGVFDANFDMVRIDDVEMEVESENKVESENVAGKVESENVAVEMEVDNVAVEVEVDNENVAVEVEVDSENGAVDVDLSSQHVVDTVSIPDEKVISTSVDDDLDAELDRLLDDVRRQKEEERLLLEKQKIEDRKRRREAEEEQRRIAAEEEQRRREVEQEQQRRREEQRNREAKEQQKRREAEEQQKRREAEEQQRRQEETKEHLPSKAEESTKWISEKWNERASFVRTSLSELNRNCKYLRHFLGKTSPEGCAALSLSHKECGFTPPISRNDERPPASDIVRFLWSGGKGCFCCSKTKSDSIDTSWFVTKLKNAQISLELYETCVVRTFSFRSYNILHTHT